MTNDEAKRPADKIKAMMDESYRLYIKSMESDQTDAIKYRSNFWKGKFEGHRESLAALLAASDSLEDQNGTSSS